MSLNQPISRQELFLAVKSFSGKRALTFWLLVGVFVLSAIGILLYLNYHFSIVVAARGGTLIEGLIGSPRFINPLLATSEADRDLTTLIYSGLLRTDTTGQLIPDLAESYEVSPDGLIYTFTLKKDLSWHDGRELTTEDIEFTIQKAQDPLLKSPRRAGFEGVKIERPDNQTISFFLKQAYPLFLENLAIGILPKHLWEQFDPASFSLGQYNTESIGSGPYKITKIRKNSLGVPESYELVSHKHFALGQPPISKLVLKFFPNEEELIQAYKRNKIDSLSTISAENAKELDEAGTPTMGVPLPRIFGVFFNQNKASIFTNQEVREALSLAVDRQRIVDMVLLGYGQKISGPLPLAALALIYPELLEKNTSEDEAASSTISNLEQARQLLAQNGWAINEKTGYLEKKTKKETLTLTFSLYTSDTAELRQTAELIKQDWEKLGAAVELKIFEIGDLNQNIIRPRQYESLLFGEVLGRRPDPFSFWHSSQRLDPGLNIALYANISVDNILEQLRNATDREEIAELYQKLQTEIQKDSPATFLYSPYFLYVVPSKIKNLTLPPINTPSDRFLNIYQWHLKTERVWKIFTKD